MSLFVLFYSKFHFHFCIISTKQIADFAQRIFPVDSDTYCSVYLLKANDDFNVFSGFIFSLWQQTWERAHRG